ncbi:uncharacterized protein METZ01_LOCUS294396, partial [marine metagenome]
MQQQTMSTSLNLDKSALQTHYNRAEEEFAKLIHSDDLDSAVKLNPDLITHFEDTLSLAIVDAYKNDVASDRTHLFLQRVLYYINRLKLF